MKSISSTNAYKLKSEFWEDEAGTADVCTECTAVGNEESGATYICTSADDSDVSGCVDGF